MVGIPPLKSSDQKGVELKLNAVCRGKAIKAEAEAEAEEENFLDFKIFAKHSAFSD